MSFDLAVWRTNQKLTESEALAIYREIVKGNISSVPPHDSLLEFYSDLHAVFPLGVAGLTEDEIDEMPWSLDYRPSRSHYILCIQWPRAEEVAPVVASLAHKHALVCFDPQTGEIVSP